MRRTGGSSRLEHQPALDGLRALAVLMVLMFHGGVSWMRGGYFGVSVFFTLSGFLITSLLVREFDSTQRIAPARFYARRAKRLLPASTLCLAIVAILAGHDVWRGADHIRRDALGALFQVANWVQLAGGGSYTDLQSKSAGLVSPLDHYWSLAVEEQFYWLWPLCFWGLARLARRRGWSLTRLMLGVVLAFAVAAPVIALVWGRDAAYWATPARAAEILIGALLAVAIRDGRAPEPRAWMAPVFVAVIVALAVVLPAAGGPAYHGAFPLLAVASAGLLLGLQRPGPVVTALSWRPMVGLGAISYGVYLYHFPIFVLISAQRVGRGGWQLLALRLSATLGIAVVSYFAIERPIRRSTWDGARTLMYATCAVGLLVIGIAFVPTRTATYWTASASAVAAAEIPTDGSVAPLATPPTTAPATTVPPSIVPATATTTAAAAETTPTPATTSAATPLTTTPATIAAGSSVTNSSVTNSSVLDPSEIIVPPLPALSRPVRIVVVGDSTAQAVGTGLVQWAVANPTVAQVDVLAEPGCGFVREGTVLPDPGMAEAVGTFATDCARQLDVDLPHALETLHPDVVMLMTTINDVLPRQFAAGGTYLAPTDHEFLTHAIPDYLAIEEMILDTSTAHVAWVRPPTIDPYWVDHTMPARDPGAHWVIDHVMTTVAAVHPARAAVIDLRAWMEQVGAETDLSYRPDGIHETTATALDLASRFMGPELIAEATRTG
ncbi:MAG: putative acyltransferase [Ilumatobacteraceae bacterium]|nr:putative acyltransferase [Ilumatobacteraceae bacterium]